MLVIVFVRHEYSMLKLIFSKDDSLFKKNNKLASFWGAPLENHCCPYIWPSHCKDSHTLHLKKGNKSNTNSQLNFKANFHQEFELFSEEKKIC